MSRTVTLAPQLPRVHLEAQLCRSSLKRPSSVPKSGSKVKLTIPQEVGEILPIKGNLKGTLKVLKEPSNDPKWRAP